MMKKLCFKATFILLLLSITLGLSGCLAKEKVFTYQELSITLTTDFVEQEIVGQTVAYQSITTFVSALKETITDFEGTVSSLREYANLVIATNKLSATVEEEDGLILFSYERSAGGKDYYYLATVHKNSTHFWLIQFGCFKDKKEEALPTLKTYAKSVVLA